jgi:hypothetical protein
VPAPTLPDLKAHLDITGTDDDAELTTMLDAAIDVVENIVGPLASSPVTETHYAASGPTLVTRRAPLIALTAVSTRWYPGTVWADQDVTDYEVNTDTGEIRQANGWLFCGDVKLTYTVGYSDVPPSVSLATLVIAANLWETQRGAMPLPANSTDDEYAANVGFAPAIPNRAKTLLEPHALGPRIA